MCNYALSTVLELLGKDQNDFIVFYLREGPISGREELMKRLVSGKFAPPLPVLIENSGENVEFIKKLFVSFTGVGVDSDIEECRAWWQTDGKNWRARRILVVVWLSENSSLEVEDIIWTVDGLEPEPSLGLTMTSRDDVEVSVIRKEQLISIRGPLGRHMTKQFYIGTLDGKPVGTNALVPRITKALGSLHKPKPTQM